MTLDVPVRKTNTAQEAFNGLKILTNIIQSAKNVKTTDSFANALKKT